MEGQENRPVDREGEDTDAALLRRCQRGDEQALAELVRRYQGMIYGVALRVSGDPALAEEATVDAFYKIWRKARQWRGETSPDAWICRTAVRTVMDLRRSRQRWWKRTEMAAGNAEAEQIVPEPADDLMVDEQRRLSANLLDRAIRSLGETDRALVHLYYFEERGLKEIEAILDVPHATLKMRLTRARQKLRLVLEKEQHEDT